jgi:hypothetical protein
MTWSQGVFACCGGVLAPATGVLCAWRLRRQDGSPLKGFILGFGSVLCVMIAVSFLAILVFPGYPGEPVPEPTAISFTIPVLAASILALWLVDWRQARTNRFPFLGASSLVVLYLAGILATYELFTWPYRKALPLSASEVNEYVWTDGFLPDFSYYLRARITEEQFLNYVARFKLAIDGKRELFAGPHEVPWWSPSSGAHEVYELENGDWSMEAIYDNGIMWVMARLQ